MANNTKRGTFPALTSGNPRGRPPGSGQAAAWRAAIGKDAGKVIATVVRLAIAGDVGCCRLVMERAVPALKPLDSGVVVEMPAGGTLTEKAAALVNAMASGAVSAQAAASMIAALSQLVRVSETDEVMRRLEALEADYQKGRIP